MYYEEKFIDGQLMCRTTPNGEWRVRGDSVGIVANQLLQLTEEQRTDVFALFCTHCGSDNPRCQCWNDE